METLQHLQPHRAMTVYLGLGSNLGRRRKILGTALAALDAMEGCRLEQRSSLYETEPEGSGSNWYLNLVVRIETLYSPQQLLGHLLDLERKLGRDRSRPWPDRTLDIDILLWENEVIDSIDLTVPHPKLHERLFVLAPLAEIAPRVRHPILGVCAQEMIRTAPDAKIHPAGNLPDSINRA